MGIFSILGFVLLFLFVDYTKASHSNFDPSNLISDEAFVAADSMSLAEIQTFLEEKGSFLASYSEGGKTAGEIIWNASHGQGEATQKVSGTNLTIKSSISPKVILVTLQKEQSLITKRTRDDSALRKAMGYACPDNGTCDPAYAGFTKQVENGTWQLYWNYERAKGRGYSDFQVGQTVTLSNSDGSQTTVTFSNRATASLYRYTPHVYNGNHNFNYYYRLWWPILQASWAGQSEYPILSPGRSTRLRLIMYNSGDAVWYRNGNTPLRLGTARERDRIPFYIREDLIWGNPSGWAAPNRVLLQEERVNPGQYGIFNFWLTIPPTTGEGTYKEYFQIVQDNVSWLADQGIFWEIKVQYPKARWLEQSPYPILKTGQSYLFIVKFQNTGNVTWYGENYSNPIRLGTARPKDRIPRFVREDWQSQQVSGWVKENRVKMVEETVLPGGIATFIFWMSVPDGLSAGTYREYFQLVQEGVTWISDPIVYWDIKVE